jgi:putative transposase
VAAPLDFGVATVARWSQRYRAKGAVEPGEIGGHRVAVMSGISDWLIEQTGSDFTLRGRVAELAERGGRVDRVQVWRFVHAEGLSFKRKRAAGRAVVPVDRQTAGAADEVSVPG